MLTLIAGAPLSEAAVWDAVTLVTGFVDETVVRDAFAGKLVLPASVAVVMPERDVEVDLSLELVPLTVET
jgi:hypothetical protein